MMKFIRYGDISSLPDSAQALFEQSQQCSIFYSRVWFETLIEHALNESQTPLFLGVESEDKLLCLLPLLAHEDGSYRALSNHYTTHYSILIDASVDALEVLTCLADGLVTLPFSSLRLEPVDVFDPMLWTLQHALEPHGYKAHGYFSFENWITEVKPGAYQDYLLARPSALRNTLKRKLNKLNREQQYEFLLYTRESIDEALLHYQQVYQLSWKGNEKFADFTPALVKKLAALGWLRLGVLFIQQQPVAAQIWFVAFGKASIYRLAYDEAWKLYSPGSLLTAYMMRQAIDSDRVSQIDFLTGKESYKRDWMSIGQQRGGLQWVKLKPPQKISTLEGFKLKMKALLAWLKR